MERPRAASGAGGSRAAAAAARLPPPPPPPPPARPTAAAAAVERMAAQIEADYPDVRHVRPEYAMRKGGAPLLLVDTRTAAERRVSVLPGAVPLRELERRLALEDAEAGGGEAVSRPEYVLYCTIGKRSSDHCRRLARKHPSAAARLGNLRGSLLAWAHASLPLEGGATRLHCYARPWALLPEGGAYEPVVFSPLGLIAASVFSS